MKLSKKYLVMAGLALVASASATASELNVEVEDLSDPTYNVEVNDVVMPLKGLDMDVELTRADEVETTVGLDYVVDLSDETGVKPFDLALGAEFESGNKDTTFEADVSKTYGDFKPYIELDYTLVDSGKNNGDYIVGTKYTGITDVTLGAEYNGEYAGTDVDEFELSASYKLDDRMTASIEHTMDRNTRTDSTEVAGKYAFNANLYTVATYTFEETKDDTFGLEVGYKF